MADRFENIDSAVEFLNRLSETNAGFSEILDAQRRLKEALSALSIDEISRLFKTLGDNTKAVVDTLSSVQSEGEKYEEKQRTLNNELDAINNILKDVSKEDKDYLTKRKEQVEEQLKENKDQHDAFLKGEEEQHKVEKDLAERRRQQKEEQANKDKQLEEKNRRETEERYRKVGEQFSKLSRGFISLFQNSVDSIARNYNENAGKLSAAFGSTVNDISALQSKIANELRSDDLRSAISNIAVMAEVSSLTASGYTNEQKIQQSATGIAVGRLIAPNLDFNTSTVKNLTNVFGSDFIEKFSAIQLAVQDTANSNINLSANLSKLMDDLEPVYQNAEYQNIAMQDTADIQATLSAAMDAGKITKAQSDEYLSMIVELMDPSKAFKSSSTTVRAAATTYDFGSGSPLQALEALLGARQTMYGGIDMSSSYRGNVSRSLAASAFGENTLSATYSQSGLYGLDILRTENLEDVYQKGLSNLQSGDYTTKADREKNYLANSATAQGVAKIQEWLPVTYGVFSTALFAQLSTLPTRIAKAIAAHKVVGDGSSSTIAGSGSSFINSSIFGGMGADSPTRLGRFGGRLFSGFNMLSYGAGAFGLSNLLGQWDSNRSFTQNVGFGGDTLSATLSNAGVGMAAGSLLGSFFPGFGNVIGGVVGAVVGAVGGFIASSKAQKEAQEANTKALQEQTATTKSIFGEGISALDTLESKREVARGGGIVHLASGDYSIDYSKSNYPGFASGLSYVPYDDYVVRLHKGEAVVTASAANSLRQQNPNFWYSGTQMNSDNYVVDALERQTESIVSAVRGDEKLRPLSSSNSGPKQYVITNNI